MDDTFNIQEMKIRLIEMRAALHRYRVNAEELRVALNLDLQWEQKEVLRSESILQSHVRDIDKFLSKRENKHKQ
jgi:hypothetical protein